MRRFVDEETKRELQEFAELISIATLTKVGLLPEFINQSDAWLQFGKANVKNWVSWGIVKRIKEGERNTTVRYSRIELEAAARSNNRLLYFKFNPDAGSSFN